MEITVLKDAPVGVFDSGVGGISVLRKLVEILPNENYIFYGDSANAPYGTKQDEEVFRLSSAVFKKLIDKGVKAVVIACNTATSVAANELRKSYPEIPIIGMEPAVKPAIVDNPGGRIAVMATEMTLKREKFMDLLSAYSNDAEIISMPCPALVEFVESNRMNDAEVEAYVRERFHTVAQGKSVDAVVLGCTHFPFVIDSIRAVVGKDISFYDGSEGTARELARQLESINISSDKKRGYVEIINSAGKSQKELSEFLFKGEGLCL